MVARDLSVSLAWVGVLQTVVYLLFVCAIDLYEREELKYIVPVFVWGLSVAIGVSLVFNTIFALTLSSAISVEAASFVTAVTVGALDRGVEQRPCAPDRVRSRVVGGLEPRRICLLGSDGRYSVRLGGRIRILHRR